MRITITAARERHEARSGTALMQREHDFNELSGRLSSESLIRCDEPLAKRTTLRVGGPADLFVEPASEPDRICWCAMAVSAAW
jgi:hypothetical protein